MVHWRKEHLYYPGESESNENLNEEGDDETSEIFAVVEKQQIRGQLLVLDYKQFKAARHIQKYVRSFLVRRELKQKIKAAIIIQKWWRGFEAQDMFLHQAENKLQRVLEKQYNTAAIKIQKMWRGFWSRTFVFDMYFLKQIQERKMEDVLFSVAQQLHNMLREGQIPGLYSLRNGEALLSVQDLKLSLSYRFHNQFVGCQIAGRKAMLVEKCRKHDQAKYYTEVPFCGFNDDNTCKRQHDEPPPLTAYEIFDHHLLDIVQGFMNAGRFREVRDQQHERLKSRRRTYSDVTHFRKQRVFCNDVLDRIKHWHFEDDKLTPIPSNPSVLTVEASGIKLNKFMDDFVKYVDQDYHCSCLADYCPPYDVK